MAREKSWNPGKLTAELTEADAVIDPLLEAAKITSIKVNGVDTPAAKAPIGARFKAWADVAKAGATSQDATELAVLNGQITSQLEKVTGELAVAQAAVGTLTQEKNTVTADLGVARAANEKHTADFAQLDSQHKIVVGQLTAKTGEMNAFNARISQRCLDVGCLADLKGADGKILASTASADEKLAAANLIPLNDKLTAYDGAVNAAVAKVTGVPFSQIPNGGPGNGSANIAQINVLAEYERLKATDSIAAGNFYRANKAAYDAAWKAKNG